MRDLTETLRCVFNDADFIHFCYTGSTMTAERDSDEYRKVMQDALSSEEVYECGNNANVRSFFPLGESHVIFYFSDKRLFVCIPSKFIKDYDKRSLLRWCKYDFRDVDGETYLVNNGVIVATSSVVPSGENVIDYFFELTLGRVYGTEQDLQ